MKFFSALPLLFITSLLSAQKQSGLSIYFDFDKAAIRQTQAKLLDSLVATLTPGEKNTSIEIDGHCDSKGRDGYNDTLSLKRAMSVKKYLLKKGIPQTSIKNVEGYGKKKPAVDAHTIDHDRYNRRVELFITNEDSKPGENYISKILSDTATRVGSRIIMKNLNFEGGMHRLLNSSLPTLYDLLKALQENENLVIRIEGHICCVPDAADGYDFETRTNNLSEERARAVYTFLINNNIKRERVSFIGFGHKMPIYSYPEKNEEQRIMNRRVEIRVLRK